jgi:cytolysin (calcineurin-like family phosphatase)
MRLGPGSIMSGRTPSRDLQFFFENYKVDVHNTHVHLPL